MFSKLIKISDRKYKIYKRHKSTMVVAIPHEYVQFKNLQRGQHMYAFFSNYKGKKLLCYSEHEIKGTKKIMVVSVNRTQFRLTVPKMIFNTLNHSDNCYYEAYHNNNGLLIFQQKKEK